MRLLSSVKSIAAYTSAHHRAEFLLSRFCYSEIVLRKDKRLNVRGTCRNYLVSVENRREMLNLAEVSENEQRVFIGSFDHVLSDLDGVIWALYKALPGASECVASLRRYGKKVHFVTNNSTVSVNKIKKALDDNNIITDREDIILPISAIVAYLKEINFTKQLYVIASSSFKQALKDAGFSLVEDGPQVIEESLHAIIANTQDDPNVGGVLVDFDMNLSYIKLQKALTYLKRDDCIFLTGAADAMVTVGTYGPLIGPYYFLQPLLTVASKKFCQIAKPDLKLNEFIVKKYKISIPQRVLFIGDSLNEDMHFATKCGYQKLLVLTGNTTREQMITWEYPEKDKPQYYVESMNVLYKILEKLGENPLC